MNTVAQEDEKEIELRIDPEHIARESAVPKRRGA